MSSPFSSMRGLPFRPAVSAITPSHEQRLSAWLAAQPARVNRRRARRVVMQTAHRYANGARVPFNEGLEAVLYQLETERAREVAAAESMVAQ